jgi:hypothetical protein
MLTTSFNSGVSIEAVRRRLGHASTETTQLYALLDDKVADAEIRAARTEQAQRNRVYLVTAVLPTPRIDAEAVEARDRMTWRELLGGTWDNVAEAIAVKTGRPFDIAATHAWTAVKASKKAIGFACCPDPETIMIDDRFITMTGKEAPYLTYVSVCTGRDESIPL